MTVRGESHRKQSTGLSPLVSQISNEFSPTCIINNASLSDFKFPYEVSNVDEESKFKFKTMGQDQPGDVFINPLNHPEWSEIRDIQFSDHEPTIPTQAAGEEES